MRKTNVKSHIRTVKGRPIRVVRHERTVHGRFEGRPLSTKRQFNAFNKRMHDIQESKGRFGKQERPLQLRYKYTDDWGRPVFEDVNNKRSLVFVDGVPHTMTKAGEPDVPVKQLYKGGFNLKERGQDKDYYASRQRPFGVVRHQEIKLTKDVDGDPYVFVKDYEAKDGMLIKEHRYTGRSFKSQAKAERFVKETMKDMEGR